MVQIITKMIVGKTLFVVTADHSTEATETFEQKLKKLDVQHAFDNRRVIRKLSDNSHNTLAVYPKKANMVSDI